MKILVLFAAIVASFPLDINQSILTITGASAIEELDESEVERFQRLSDHPIDLNTASRSRLLSSGLFSVYQTASIVDYRSRTGDILSGEELSLVDGFSPEYARALAPFVTFSSSSAPGAPRSGRVSNTLVLRTSLRHDDGGGVIGAYALKESLSIGERAELNWSTRTTYSKGDLGIGTVSAACYGRRHLGKVVLGHFNARFGQGLNIWSGFSLSGVSSAGSLRKNPSGLGATTSFSPSFCGVATDWTFGCWTLSAAYSFPSLPLLNVSRSFRNFSCGASATPDAVSADWRLGFRDFCFYGELAWDGAPAAVGGLLWVPSYGKTVALSGRYYSPDFKGVNAGPVRSGTKASDEAGVSAAYSSSLLNVTADICVHPLKRTGQIRGVASISPVFELGPFSIKPSLRANARFRPQETFRWRSDLRSDLDVALGPLSAHARLEFLKCKDLAWLGYAELGYSSSLSAWCRWTLFKVDEWDDRIYVYERDAPGTFNVPSYYGRGWGLSLYLNWKISRHHRLCLRASTLQYRWMEEPKPSRSEVRVQYCLSL